MLRWFRSATRLGGVICVVLAGAGNVTAQSPAVSAAANRPAPSLFGGMTQRSGESPAGLLVTVTEAYDQNVLAEGGPPQGALESGGLFTDFTANFNARVQRRRLQFSTSAGSDVRYYPDQHTTVGVGHYGSFAITHSSPRTVFFADGGIAYAPSYLYRLFASVAPVPAVGDAVATGYAVTDTSSFNYDLRAGLSQNLTPRTRVIVRGAGRLTDFLHEEQQTFGYGSRDLTTYESGVTLSRGVSRYVNLNVGYTYRRAQYFTGVYPTEHDVTFALEYERPISRTRRSHVHFGASTVIVDAPAPGDGSGELRRQYKAAGDVTYVRQFGRTWQAAAAYRRGVGYIEGFDTPVLTDAVNVNVAGLFSRRLDFLASGSYSLGEPVVAGQLTGFTTYAGDLRMRIALSSTWAVYAEYLYYYYDFGRGFLPAGVTPQMSRNTVRTGLSLWVPVGGR